MTHKKHHHVVKRGIRIKYYITLFLLLFFVAFSTFFFAKWLNNTLEEIEFPFKIIDPKVTSVLINNDGVSTPKVVIDFKTNSPGVATIFFSGQGYNLEIPFKETKNVFTTTIYLDNNSFSKTYNILIEAHDLEGNKDSYQATIQTVKNLEPTIIIN